MRQPSQDLFDVFSFHATKMVGSAGSVSGVDREVLFVVRDERFTVRRSKLQVRGLCASV